MTRLRVFPKGMFFAFSAQHAAMPAKMPQEFLASSNNDEFLMSVGGQGA